MLAEGAGAAGDAEVQGPVAGMSGERLLVLRQCFLMLAGLFQRLATLKNRWQGLRFFLLHHHFYVAYPSIAKRERAAPVAGYEVFSR